MEKIIICLFVIFLFIPSIVYADPIQVTVGEKKTFNITLANPLEVPDTFHIELSGSNSKIGYWTWFEGHRHDGQKMKTSVNVGPKQSASVAVVVFGGEANTNGNVYVNIKSSAKGISTQISKSVSITYGGDGQYVQTPEFGWFFYILIGLIAAIFLI